MKIDTSLRVTQTMHAHWSFWRLMAFCRVTRAVATFAVAFCAVL
jgi:hypothetical protein